MANNDDQIDIVVKVDTKTGQVALEQLGGTVQQTQAKAENMRQGFTKLQAATVTLSSSLYIAQIAAASLKKVFTSFTDAMSQGSMFGDLESELVRLTGGSKQFADVLTNTMAKASGDALSKLDALKTGIEGLRAGMSPQELTVITAATRQFAEQGEDLKGTLDSITMAYATGRTMALRRLGVQIEEEAQEKKLTDAIGIKGVKLTEEGRLLAGRKALMDALIPIAQQGLQIDKDAGDVVKSLNASWNDNILAVEKAIANNTLLNDVLNGIVSIVQHASKNIREHLINTLDDLDFKYQVLINTIKTFSITAGEEMTVQKTLADAALAQAKERKALREIEEKSIETKKDLITYAKEHKGLIYDLTAATEQANKSAKEEAEKLAKVKEEIYELNSSTGISSYISKVKSLYEAHKQLRTDTKTAADELEHLKDAYIKAGGEAKNWEIIVSNATNKTSWLDSLFKPDTDLSAGLGNALGEQIANSISSGIEAAFEGNNRESYGELFSSIGQTIGTTIGTAIGGPLVGAITGAIGKAFGSDISKVGKSTKSTKGIWDKWGGMLSMSTFGATQLLDAAGFNWTGQDSEGTAARKQVDKYFANLFDAANLSIIVGGELKEMRDLVFNGNTFFGGESDLGSGPNNSFLSTLSADVQSAYVGVGAAFEELLGLGEEFQGYLAGVLANNLGNLNNLQLALEATGKTTEELTAALEESFNKGKLSAMEYMDALNAIKRVSEKGIPDAVGALGTAFENVFAAGWNGGNVLIDALGDVGVEAQELGAETLPQMADVLVNTFGFAAADVMNFMEAMKASGINSVADLVEASTEQLNVLAANYQSVMEGGQATYTYTPDASSSSYSGGSSRSSSSSKSSNYSQLIDLVTASDRLAAVIAKKQAGQLTDKQLTKEITAIYKEGTSALKAQTAAQEKANKELEKTGKVTAATQKKLLEANEAYEEFTNSLTSSGETINSALFSFVQNFTGNVDLIKLAAQAAGKSFDDMQQSAVNAFLAGNLTASAALAQINDSSAGISGQHGAVGQAYQNLLSHGLAGGRFSINDLKAMAAETGELGGTTLDDMMTALQLQGVSDSDVSKIFVALENNGIDTLDALENISDTTAISILASLEDLGTPFQTTSNELKKLLDQMTEIANTTTTVSVNVKTFMDADTKAMLEKIGVNVPSAVTTTAGAGNSTDTRQGANGVNWTRVSAGVYRKSTDKKLYKLVGSRYIPL